MDKRIVRLRNEVNSHLCSLEYLKIRVDRGEMTMRSYNSFKQKYLYDLKEASQKLKRVKQEDRKARILAKQLSK